MYNMRIKHDMCVFCVWYTHTLKLLQQITDDASDFLLLIYSSFSNYYKIY
jgi:hypothetical protein